MFCIMQHVDVLHLSVEYGKIFIVGICKDASPLFPTNP